MQLSRVLIQNVMGIEYQEFAAGALTIIRGPNGVGKSSVLRAISDVFSGGHDPAIIRQGAKKAEVILTLDDNSTITKSITPKGQTTVVKTSEGAVVPAPMTFVNELASGFAFDPLAFVNAPHKERAAYLSQVMPITITKAQVVAAIESRKLVPQIEKLITAATFDIASLNGQRKKLFEDRSGVNKAIKILEGTIDTLRKTMPGNWKPEGDADSILKNAQDKLDTANAELANIRQQRAEKMQEIDRATQADLSAVAQWEAEEIDKIRLEATSRRNTITAAVQEIREAAHGSFDESIEQATQQVEAAISERSAVQEQAKLFAKQKETAASLQQYMEDLRSANAEAELYTQAMGAIDAAKEAALKTSPIPGLSVIDGEVMYQQDGLDAPIPFDNINTQLQYKIALRIASMGAGKLGLMVLDNTEAMDEANWAEFKAAAVESGFQIMAARVDNINELDIEPVNATA